MSNDLTFEQLLDSINSKLTEQEKEVISVLVKDGWATGNFEEILIAARRLSE